MRWRPQLLGAGMIAALALLAYFQVDRPVAFYCEDLPPALVDPADRLTGFGNSLWYLVGTGFAGLGFHFAWRRERWRDAAVFVFAAIAGSGIIVNLGKVLVGRARPVRLIEDGFYGATPFAIGYEVNSFPSGHSSTAFALALALAWMLPGSRWLWLPAAGLVASTRVLLNHHYVSDVLVGSWIALLFTAWLARHLDRRGHLPRFWRKQARDGRPAAVAD